MIDAQEKYFFLSLKYNISKIHLDTKCHLATVRRRGGIYFFRRKFMNKMKRILTIVLTLALIVTMMPMNLTNVNAKSTTRLSINIC